LRFIWFPFKPELPVDLFRTVPVTMAAFVPRCRELRSAIEFCRAELGEERGAVEPESLACGVSVSGAPIRFVGAERSFGTFEFAPM
jgi:hypothetical protein